MVSTRGTTATDNSSTADTAALSRQEIDAKNAQLPGGPVPASAFVEPDFSGVAEVHEFAGLLFDMDGTIIDSTAAVERHWTQIGEELGVNPNVILATSHGRRSIDILKLIDPSKANWEYVSEIEGIIPKLYGADAREIPGAVALLNSLNDAGCPWTIVTSGSRALVSGWLEALNLPRPPATEKTDGLVTAEDVADGKPDPACYALGRDRLFPAHGNSAELPVLVLEDAPAGIKAGYAAGCRVVALATSHSVEQLVPTPAEWIVRDLESVRILGYDAQRQRVRVEISKGLRR